MPSFTFGITYDYLCPFARNVAEHIVTALQGGADWDVEFVPYSQMQGSLEHDETPVWDRLDALRQPGVLALAAGLAVRDRQPQRFLDAHLALFAARHDEGRDIADPEVVTDALARVGVDVDDVFAAIETGEPLEVLAKEHDWAVETHTVWGVPTFLGSDRAVYVRLLSRPHGNAGRARFEIERIVDLVDNVGAIHEFKQTDQRI